MLPTKTKHMKPWNYKPALLLLVMLMVARIMHAEDYRVQEIIRKSVAISPTGRVEIENKYGNIIVHTWEKDSLSLVITKEAAHSKLENAEKLLDLITIDFWNTEQFVRVNTRFYEQKGWLGNLLQSSWESGKQLVGESSLSVNYELYVPVQQQLTITNRFGDVVVPPMLQRMSLDVSHGLIEADGLADGSWVRMQFGTGRFRQVGKVQLEVAFSDIVIDKGVNLAITSKSCTYRIGRLEELLVVESIKDDLDIESVGSLRGKATFSDVRIALLKGSSQWESSFGSITIRKVSPFATTLTFVGNNTRYNLYLTEDVKRPVQIINVNSKGVSLPMRAVIRQEELTAGSTYILKATIGNGTSLQPLSIDTKGSFIDIQFTAL